MQVSCQVLTTNPAAAAAPTSDVRQTCVSNQGYPLHTRTCSHSFGCSCAWCCSLRRIGSFKLSGVGSLLCLTVLGSRKPVDDWGAKKNSKFILRVGNWEHLLVLAVVSSQVRHGYADAELNLDSVCGGIQSVGEMVSSSIQWLRCFPANTKLIPRDFKVFIAGGQARDAIDTESMASSGSRVHEKASSTPLLVWVTFLRRARASGRAMAVPLFKSRRLFSGVSDPAPLRTSPYGVQRSWSCGPGGVGHSACSLSGILVLNKVCVSRVAQLNSFSPPQHIHTMSKGVDRAARQCHCVVLWAGNVATYNSNLMREETDRRSQGASAYLLNGLWILLCGFGGPQLAWWIIASAMLKGWYCERASCSVFRRWGLPAGLWWLSGFSRDSDKLGINESLFWNWEWMSVRSPHGCRALWSRVDELVGPFEDSMLSEEACFLLTDTADNASSFLAILGHPVWPCGLIYGSSGGASCCAVLLFLRSYC